MFHNLFVLKFLLLLIGCFNKLMTNNFEQKDLFILKFARPEHQKFKRNYEFSKKDNFEKEQKIYNQSFINQTFIFYFIIYYLGNCFTHYIFYKIKKAWFLLIAPIILGFIMSISYIIFLKIQINNNIYVFFLYLYKTFKDHNLYIKEMFFNNFWYFTFYSIIFQMFTVILPFEIDNIRYSQHNIIYSDFSKDNQLIQDIFVKYFLIINFIVTLLFLTILFYSNYKYDNDFYFYLYSISLKSKTIMFDGRDVFFYFTMLSYLKNVNKTLYQLNNSDIEPLRIVFKKNKKLIFLLS